MSQRYEKIQNKYYSVSDTDIIKHLYAAEEAQTLHFIIFTNDDYFKNKVNPWSASRILKFGHIRGQDFHILFYISENNMMRVHFKLMLHNAM